MSGTITSALHTPLTLTRFLSHEALTKHEATITLRDLAYNIAKTRKPTKVDLPWLKLASFGDVATDKGSLRNNANNAFRLGRRVAIIDQGDAGPEAAAELLRQANIAALIYTSPSHHTVDKDGKYLGERWRVLCPCSASCTTTERYALLSRVNGVLGGILASESFTQSQSYYFGGVGNAKPQTILVEGRPIDLATDLDATAVGKPGGEKLDRIELPKGLEPDETALAALKAACALFDTMEDRQQGRHLYAVGRHDGRRAVRAVRASGAGRMRGCDPGSHGELQRRTRTGLRYRDIRRDGRRSETRASLRTCGQCSG